MIKYDEIFESIEIAALEPEVEASRLFISLCYVAVRSQLMNEPSDNELKSLADTLIDMIQDTLKIELSTEGIRTYLYNIIDIARSPSLMKQILGEGWWGRLQSLGIEEMLHNFLGEGIDVKPSSTKQPEVGNTPSNLNYKVQEIPNASKNPFGFHFHQPDEEKSKDEEENEFDIYKMEQ